MDNRLDRYLQSVAHELRRLPQERREEELRELRQHLEAIVARLVEGGLSEVEAVEAATAQFGEAGTVGHELVRVVPRHESRRRTLAAGACAVMCYLGLNLLLFIDHDLFAFLVPSLRVSRVLSQVMYSLTQVMASGNALVFFMAPLIAGIVFRCIGPRSSSRTAFWLFGGTSCLLMTVIVLTR